MNCNLNNVITLMAVMAALIVAAIAAALVSLLIPAPWDAVILVGAAIAAAGALAMINAIESAFQAYQTCRDQENTIIHQAWMRWLRLTITGPGSGPARRANT